MSYADAISQISLVQSQITQIEGQLASLQSAFSPSSTASTGATAASGTAASGGVASSANTASFADMLAGATGTTLPSTTTTATTTTGTGSATLPANASAMLTSNQQQFASRLAADTGLDPGVVSSWLLAEESGGAAVARQGAANNDWLNIGYTDSATYGSGDSVWSNPLTAADATAGWLKGQDTIPGYGTASAGIQAILQTAGQAPSAQISALQNSGWASSGYPDLSTLYAQVTG